MRVFVNCSNLTSGGGLTVGLGVISALYNLNSDNEFVVFIPNVSDYQSFESTESIKIIKNTNEGVLSKLFLEWSLAKLLKKEKCDAVLSLTNYAIPVKISQSLLLHWPYAVYPENEIWQNMSSLNLLKRKVRLFKLKYLLPYSNKLIVQTEVMKKRARMHLVPKKQIDVITSSVGFLGDNINQSLLTQIEKLREEGNKVFLCINEYYEHKNLEILIPLAKKIQESGLKIKFITTIEKDIFKTRFHNVDDVVVNVERVSRTETKSLFKACDALFFPSLLETFGIPLVEAQDVGLPIYVADLDYAKTVCGDNAIFFNPSNVKDIFRKIQLAPISPIKQNTDWNSIAIELLNSIQK